MVPWRDPADGKHQMWHRLGERICLSRSGLSFPECSMKDLNKVVGKPTPFPEYVQE